MLSSRNEWIVVGVLIAYLAFVPSLQIVRDLLATPIGKALGLAGIVYVYKYVSCPAALLLVIAYVRCARSSGLEMFTTPTATVEPTITCPDGYAYDSMIKECKPSSSMSGSIPPSPPESGVGASVNTPPPNASLSTAPMTTPTATMPPPMMPPNTSGGVQPSSGSSSSVSPV